MLTCFLFISFFFRLFESWPYKLIQNERAGEKFAISKVPKPSHFLVVLYNNVLGDENIGIVYHTRTEYKFYYKKSEMASE